MKEIKGYVKAMIDQHKLAIKILGEKHIKTSSQKCYVDELEILLEIIEEKEAALEVPVQAQPMVINCHVNINEAVSIDEIAKLLAEQLKKTTAQEVPVQEQYLSKCTHCGKINQISLPSHIDKEPNFCMNCGNKTQYIKNQSQVD